jgi:hypothetical protein
MDEEDTKKYEEKTKYKGNNILAAFKLGFGAIKK